jgi:hypothetical protein
VPPTQVVAVHVADMVGVIVLVGVFVGVAVAEVVGDTTTSPTEFDWLHISQAVFCTPVGVIVGV